MNKKTTEQKITFKEIQKISQQAQKFFWKKVIKLCPEAKTRDLKSVTEFQFGMACDNVVHEWRLANDPTYKPMR